MPGGKGKIKPKDGKQFSSSYQPKVIWTKKNAEKFFNDLIAWLIEKDENLFYEEFIYMVANPKDYGIRKMYSDIPGYLKTRPTFTSVLELYERAKKIQEIKLYKFGVGDELNASMTKFVLINDHNKVSENNKLDVSGEIKSNITIFEIPDNGR